MAEQNAKIDDNYRKTLLGVTDDASAEKRRLLVDATTGRLLVSATITSGAITTLNTLTAAVQTFATGTTGTDFAISSATATHTFNLPDASASARGLITTGNQTLAGIKTFSSFPVTPSSAPTTDYQMANKKYVDDAIIGEDFWDRTGTIISPNTAGDSVRDVADYNGLVITANTGAITTGSWAGTVIPANYGGTGISNNALSTLTISGNFATTLTVTNVTGVTLPTTGTLATLAGAETFTQKVSYNGLVITANTGAITTGSWSATEIGATKGGTGLTSYTLGDILYSSAANTLLQLAGNTTATKKYLVQTGNGAISAAPSWDTIAIGDIPLITPDKGGTGIANNAASTITITGNFATTLTITNTTALTLPTSGTVATTSNTLGDFAATTSLQLLGVISDETGSGSLVFGTAPTFTTSIAFNAVTDTIAGIQNQNLVDLSANETITGSWTFDNPTQVMKNDGDMTLWIQTWDNTDTNNPTIKHQRGRGTEAEPVIVVDDDTCGEWTSYGHDGTQFIRCARIYMDIDGTPGTNDMPGRIDFETTRDGAADCTLALTLDSSQNATFAGAITAVSYGGITEENLLDKTASETITGNTWAWQQLNSSPIIDLISYNNNASDQATLKFKKSAQDTEGYTVTASGETLGRIWAYGVGTDADSFDLGCGIRFEQDAAAGAANIPGRITFLTATNAATVAERMRIDSGGNLRITNATTAPSAHTDDNVLIFSKDASTGGATLGLFTECDVEAVGTFTATQKLKIWVNGVEYWIQLDAV